MTSALFDAAAKQYDETFTSTKIGKLQRNRTWNYLDSILPKHQINILELNCGTGEDAIWFAKKGHNILATDISEMMINAGQTKVKQLSLTDNISFEKLDINEIDKKSYKEKFDLVFSNFGGLNCLTENDLKSLSNKIRTLLVSNGRFIAVVMSDFCMIESLYFISKLKFNEAFRRKKMQQVNVNSSLVNTYYYSPKMFYRYFDHEFILNKVIGVGLTIPPSYLNNFFSNKIKTSHLLNKIENSIGNNLFAASISDHYLIDLVVKE